MQYTNNPLPTLPLVRFAQNFLSRPFVLTLFSPVGGDVELQVGSYIVLASTFYPDKEAKFVLRVETESQASLTEIPKAKDWNVGSSSVRSCYILCNLTANLTFTGTMGSWKTRWLHKSPNVERESQIQVYRHFSHHCYRCCWPNRSFSIKRW